MRNLFDFASLKMHLSLTLGMSVFREEMYCLTYLLNEVFLSNWRELFQEHGLLWCRYLHTQDTIGCK